MNKQKIKAFTLVELIVVITILAILGTIAFISFLGYSESARDSTRISDINNIKTSLELFSFQTSKYPKPDDYRTISYSGDIVWYQGFLGDTVISNLGRLNKKPLDPSLNVEYIYSITNNAKEYEMLGLFEGVNIALTNILVKTHAIENDIYPKIEGTYNGVYVKTDNYIIPTPSIITSEEIPTLTGMILNEVNINYQVVTGGLNIPQVGSQVAKTGSLNVTLSVFTGSITKKSTDLEKMSVIQAIKNTYDGSTIASEEKYSNILNQTTNEELLNLVNTIILNISPLPIPDTIVTNGKPWKNQYISNVTQSGALTWTETTSLPGGLTNSQVIVTKNRVYLLGGINGTVVSTVYTAQINTDGTLGTWTTSTSLPGPLAYSQAIVTKNRVYLMGGFNGSTYLSTVYTVQINPDGTLGTWTTSTSLPGPLSHSQAIVTKNRVYLMGGLISAGSISSTVYTATINTNGTLGEWITSTSLPGILAYSQSIVTNNRAYLIGGYGTSATVVYTAPINPDGSLGVWTTSSSLPSLGLRFSQAIVTKNRVYLIGGLTGFTNLSQTVYTASIDTDGILGAWTSSTNLPVGLMNSQAIVTKNRVYLIGGTSGTMFSAIKDKVFTADISGGYNDYLDMTVE